MAQLLRRLPMMVATLLVVSFLTFLLTSLLRGTPAVVILGPEGAKDPAAVAAVREDLRLDDPLPIRYVAWLGDAVTGDLGRSYYTRQEVTTAILERLPGRRHLRPAGHRGDVRAAGHPQLHDGPAAHLHARRLVGVAAGHRLDAA